MATDLVNPISVLTAATAVNTTSGTAIVFTGIPGGVKRITVMFNGVSTNGSSAVIVQIGSGSFNTSGYTSDDARINGGTGQGATTTGFAIISSSTPTYIYRGHMVLTDLSNNIWISSSLTSYSAGTGAMSMQAGSSPALSGILDRIRITTITGTNTFDTGSVNILYE